MILFMCVVYNPVFATVISRIDINGTQRMDTESVRILSETKIGDNINAEQINNIAKNLQSSGYFESVDVK